MDTVEAKREPPSKRAAIIFVHGLFSSHEVWARFRDLIECDPEIASRYDTVAHRYSSPKFSLRPTRRIPDFASLAEELGSFIEDETDQYERLVLVAHSQGGLIVQRYLADMLDNGRGNQLKRIRRVVMFACPNDGTEFLLLLRQVTSLFWRHPQAQALRPYREAINIAKRRVLHGIIYSKQVNTHECPIAIKVYAGSEDNIVTRESSRSVYPEASTLPGDHSSIIQPDSHQHRSYKALKRNLELALADPMPISVTGNAAPRPIADYLSDHPEFSLEHDIARQRVSTSVTSFTTAASKIYESLESGEHVTAIDPFTINGDRPFFWVREGSHSHSYLRLNYEAARSGVEIIRVFVVSRQDRIRYVRILEGLRQLQARIGVRAGVVTYDDLPPDCRYEFAVFANRIVDLVTFDMFGNPIENCLLWSDTDVTKYREKADHIIRYATDIDWDRPPQAQASFEDVQAFAQALRTTIENELPR